MKIAQAIARIKSYHCGIVRGEPIDLVKTRDQVLYGGPDQELTGIVVTCYASVDVIQGAMESEDIDTVICFELVDTTAAGYIRDSAMVGRNKTILAVGHFNTEEPGMKYMVEYIPIALGEPVPCIFLPSTDMYQFVTK